MRVAALAPVVAFALAGCQWTSPIQTAKQYEPGDGVSAQLGGVAVNNLLVVADKKGGSGTLVGRGTNETSQPVQVSFQVDGVQKTLNLDIEPWSSARLSDPQKSGSMAEIPNVPQPPGALVDVTVMTTGAGSETLQVPVLAPYPPYGDYHESGPTAPPTGSPTTAAAH